MFWKGGSVSLLLAFVTAYTVNEGVAQNANQENVALGLFDGASASIDEYEVRQGDTLWDISEKVLGRPELWPKVWSLNLEIGNPHWIFPGNVIRFYRQPMNYPSLADVGIAGLQVTTSVEESKPGMGASYPAIETISAPIVRRKALDEQSHRVFLNLQLTEKELQEIGQLEAHSNGRLLLARGDSVMIKLSDAEMHKRGDRFMTYQTSQKVKHPTNGDFVGYVTQVTGLIQIESTAPGEQLAHARVLHAVAEMEIGQFLTPLLRTPYVTVYPIESAMNVDGVVVALGRAGTQLAYPGQLLFVDKGLESGLQQGHRLSVYREGDSDLSPRAGQKSVATLLVVDAKADTSTCLVLESTDEIMTGFSIGTKRK